MNAFTRGIRNAFRNQIRTFSIVVILGISIGLALAMLIAHQAVGQKIDSVKSSIGNTVLVSPAGARGFEGGGNALTEAQVSTISGLSHISSVSKSLDDRLTSSQTSLKSAVDAGTLGQRFARNNGQSFAPPSGGSQSSGGAQNNSGTVSFTPPVTVLGTTDPTSLGSTQGGGTFKLTSGKNFSSSSNNNVALVGKSLAAKNNLTVGSTFTAYDTTITVMGIFDSGNTFSNNQVIMPLATVQTLSSQPGDLTNVTVNVDSVSNVDSVTSAIKSKLGSAADVTNSAESAKTTIAPLENIKSISLYSLIGAIVAGAVIILLTMIMIVRERRREIGVLKAIGASNFKVMFQFMTEAITLTVLGAVIGIAIGVAGGNPITKLLVNNSTSSNSTAMRGPGTGGGRVISRGTGFVKDNLTSIHGVVGWSIIAYGLAAAIVIAIVGSSIASYFIAKVRPAEVMRSE